MVEKGLLFRMIKVKIKAIIYFYRFFAECRFAGRCSHRGWHSCSDFPGSGSSFWSAAIALKLAVMFGHVSIQGRFITAIRDTMKCDLF